MEVCRGREATAFVSCNEAHTILKQSNFPTACERMITGGRKRGVECLNISQRPQLLHTTVTSQADKRV
jgi:DNA helicase HerA-like ATPase